VFTLLPNLILNAPVPLVSGFLSFLLRALFTCGFTSVTNGSGSGNGALGGAGGGGGGAKGGGGGGLDDLLPKHIRFHPP
tara:strand:- start:352 stop:588 length:237 start_codon:yes stop_codon:yes gene_type:complete